MTLTKNDLREALYVKTDLTKKQAAGAVENLVELIKCTLEQGEKVLISGFGKFDVIEKNPRRGRNPASGTDLMLDGRRIVTFRCSDVLRRKVNKGKGK
ncbi:MAG: integration host factor subunit alpha [Desulfatiglandaceae bacterium]